MFSGRKSPRLVEERLDGKETRNAGPKLLLNGDVKDSSYTADSYSYLHRFTCYISELYLGETRESYYTNAANS
ncbi:unnamed protein product [Gongylonema pulchrum]|uniref:Uncharacterized protein n=1 Tax=Gongylonema pulchrum TaxID=637853 RepID=A0A183DNB3_9BILA|nr:unnamed protein product [Gongylonema pulchrum]